MIKSQLFIVTALAVGVAIGLPFVARAEPVLNVDVGRQLFVDDALVSKTDLKRVWHHPVKYEGNPVMKPETPWEVNAGGNALALPKGGGFTWTTSRLSPVGNLTSRTFVTKLRDGRAGCSYPDGQQLADGSVVVVSDFDRMGRREISFVRFSPDDVIPAKARLNRTVISCADRRNRQTP